jgi:hypothetical protein
VKHETEIMGTNHDDVFSFVRFGHFVVAALQVLAKGRAGGKPLQTFSGHVRDHSRDVLYQ